MKVETVISKQWRGERGERRERLTFLNHFLPRRKSCSSFKFQVLNLIGPQLLELLPEAGWEPHSLPQMVSVGCGMRPHPPVLLGASGSSLRNSERSEMGKRAAWSPPATVLGQGARRLLKSVFLFKACRTKDGTHTHCEQGWPNRDTGRGKGQGKGGKGYLQGPIR